MAKYTARLSQVDSKTQLGPNFMGTYVDSGNQQFQNAFLANIASVRNQKKQKFEREQALMDGIVSGHFADDITAETLESISNLTGYNSNSKEYAVALNKATAKLKISVAKQQKVTDLLNRTKESFDNDQDRTYYKDDEFYNLLERNTNIDLTGAQMNKEYENYLKNVDNINTDAVREKFVEQIGTYAYGGDSKSEEGEVSGMPTLKQGSYRGKRTQFYTLENGVSVPVFNTANDVPVELVEKWASLNKASIAMMEDFVAKENAGKNHASPEAAQKAEMMAKKKFVMMEMQKVYPDYESVSDSKEQFVPGGGGTPASGDNPSALAITQLAKSIAKDESIIGKAPVVSLQIGNETFEGFDITDTFDTFNFDVVGNVGRKAQRVFAPEGEDAIYVQGADGQYTKYDRGNFADLTIRMANSDNGFKLSDVNDLPEYNQNRKSWTFDPMVTDGKVRKPQSELTQEEIQSGKWQSTGERSLIGTDFQKAQPIDVQKKEEARMLAVQNSVSQSLSNEGIVFKDLNDEYLKDNKNQREPFKKALQSTLIGKQLNGLGSSAVTNVDLGSGILVFGTDDRLIMLEFADGSKRNITMTELQTALGLEQL